MVQANPLDNNLWSEPFLRAVKTLPAPPSQIPETNIGSFEILEDRSVYVYWKRINKSDENGPDFQYRITEINQDGAIM